MIKYIFLRYLRNLGEGGFEVSESWFWSRESILSSEPLGEYEPKPAWKDRRINCGVRAATCFKADFTLKSWGKFVSSVLDGSFSDFLSNLGESIRGSGGRRREPRFKVEWFNPWDPCSIDIDFRLLKGVLQEFPTLRIPFIPGLLASSSLLYSGYTSLHIPSSSILQKVLGFFPSRDLLFQSFFGVLSNDLWGRNGLRLWGLISELFSRDFLRIVSVSVTSWTDFWRGKYWNDFRFVCGVQYCS